MTSDDLQALYELGSTRQASGVRSQDARRRADGRSAVLHRLDQLSPDQRADILARLPRLAPTDAALVWEVIDVDGATVVITGPLPDGATLVPWLTSRGGSAAVAGSLTATVPRLSTAPAAESSADQGGSLTALFSHSVVSPDPAPASGTTTPPAPPAPTATMSTPVLPTVSTQPAETPAPAVSGAAVPAVPPMDPKPTRISLQLPPPSAVPESPTAEPGGLTAIFGRPLVSDSGTLASPPVQPSVQPPPTPRDDAAKPPAGAAGQPERPGPLTRIFQPSPDAPSARNLMPPGPLSPGSGAPPVPPPRPEPRRPPPPLSPAAEQRPNALPDFNKRALDRSPLGPDGPAASSAGATGILGPKRPDAIVPPQSVRPGPDAQPTIIPALQSPRPARPPTPPIAEGPPGLATPRLRPTPLEPQRVAQPYVPPPGPTPLAQSGPYPSDFTRVVEGRGREAVPSSMERKPGPAGGAAAPNAPPKTPQAPASKSSTLVQILIAVIVVLALALLVVLYIAVTAK